MNYAEKMTYWYLRLNGFFPLTNFVLHSGDGRRGADTDVLAIRMRFTEERIGGTEDLDRVLFHEVLGLPEGFQRRIGLICEVKAGTSHRDIYSVTERRRIEIAVSRMGLLPESQKMQAVEELTTAGIWHGRRTSIACLLVKSEDNRTHGAATTKILTLEHMDDFISRRMQLYREKESDWTYFEDDFLEYTIWKTRRSRR